MVYVKVVGEIDVSRDMVFCFNNSFPIELRYDFQVMIIV